MPKPSAEEIQRRKEEAAIRKAEKLAIKLPSEEDDDGLLPIFGLVHQTQDYNYNFGDFAIKLIGCEKTKGLEKMGDYGLTVWPGAEQLAQYLQENADKYAGKSACELGAGLGLAGILAAKMDIFGTLRITDGAPTECSMLRDNLSRNGLNEALAAELPWEDVDAAEQVKAGAKCAEGFDVVMGSDVVYEDDCVLPLVQAALRLLKPGHEARFLLVFTPRKVPLQAFMQAASEHGLECVATSSLSEEDAPWASVKGAGVKLYEFARSQ
jgi:predicted nicotinamide N-methyase